MTYSFFTSEYFTGKFSLCFMSIFSLCNRQVTFCRTIFPPSLWLSRIHMSFIRLPKIRIVYHAFSHTGRFHGKCEILHIIKNLKISFLFLNGATACREILLISWGRRYCAWEHKSLNFLSRMGKRKTGSWNSHANPERKCYVDTLKLYFWVPVMFAWFKAASTRHLVGLNGKILTLLCRNEITWYFERN